MTLATKSGGLILRDGKIATNCACCDPCDGFCEGGTTPPDKIYLTISNYTAQVATYVNISVNGTYELPRNANFGDCAFYRLQLFPNDCTINPPGVFLQWKLAVGIDRSSFIISVFDVPDNENAPLGICVGFRLLRTTGFNACTQSSLSGNSSGLLVINQLDASFDWSIFVNPLP
jgi:hypothetical protein